MSGGAVVWTRRRSLVNAEASDDRHESHRPAALMGPASRDWSCSPRFPTSPRLR